MVHPELEIWIREHDPKTAEAAAHLAEVSHLQLGEPPNPFMWIHPGGANCRTEVFLGIDSSLPKLQTTQKSLHLEPPSKRFDVTTVALSHQAILPYIYSHQAVSPVFHSKASQSRHSLGCGLYSTSPDQWAVGGSFAGLCVLSDSCSV